MVRRRAVRPAHRVRRHGGALADAIGAALSLTANGFLTSLLFVVYHSPDILLTQILIESVFHDLHPAGPVLHAALPV